MRRSGWLTFSAVVLIVAGIMRVIDAIWAFGYHGTIPYNLQGALLGHSLKTYGWIWLIIGVILIVAGAAVLGPSDRPSAGSSAGSASCRGLARNLGHLRDAVLPVWSLIYIAIAVMVIYGLGSLPRASCLRVAPDPGRWRRPAVPVVPRWPVRRWPGQAGGPLLAANRAGYDADRHGFTSRPIGVRRSSSGQPVRTAPMSAGTVSNPIAGRGVIASSQVARLARDRPAAAAGTRQHPARGDTS